MTLSTLGCCVFLCQAINYCHKYFVKFFHELKQKHIILLCCSAAAFAGHFQIFVNLARSCCRCVFHWLPPTATAAATEATATAAAEATTAATDRQQPLPIASSNSHNWGMYFKNFKCQLLWQLKKRENIANECHRRQRRRRRSQVRMSNIERQPSKLVEICFTIYYRHIYLDIDIDIYWVLAGRRRMP